MISDTKARRRFKAAVKKANAMAAGYEKTQLHVFELLACVEAVRVWARCKHPAWTDEMVDVMQRAAKLIGEDE